MVLICIFNFVIIHSISIFLHQQRQNQILKMRYCRLVVYIFDVWQFTSLLLLEFIYPTIRG